MGVRPRTGAIVEENGVFLSNYVCMKPVKTLQCRGLILSEKGRIHAIPELEGKVSGN